MRLILGPAHCDLRCSMCGGKMRRHPSAKICWTCVAAIRRGMQKAYPLVKAAVEVGMLPDPINETCIDCGNPARCYDHRDYNHPLNVVPVCRSCNRKRGPGIPLGYKKARKYAYPVG